MQTYNTTPKKRETIESLWRLMHVVLDTLDFDQVVQKVVDSVLMELGYLELGYSIVVLILYDEKTNSLKRISISRTQKAKKALEVTPVPFEDIIIPLSAYENLCTRAFLDGKSYSTHDWRDILFPAYTVENARKVQSIVGIKTSMVYPIIYQGKSQGVIIFSMVKDEKQVTEEEKDLIKSFTDLVGLSVQNAKLFTALEHSSNLLKKANERLKVLDARKNEFISIAAHELRAPLTAVKGYVSMIIDGDVGVITPQAQEFLEDVLVSSNRMIRLVNNLLDVSRIEENKILYAEDYFKLSDIVKSVYSEFKLEARRKNLNFKIEIPENIVDSVYVDQDRLHEVLVNFISNALKYTTDGGVTLKLSNPKVGIIRAEVTDTGPGISKEEQEKLFAKFYRVKSHIGKTVGSGLGLYISKLLITKFGGQIGLISEPGKGSTFWFELPIKNKRQDESNTVSESTNSTQPA